MKNHSSKMLDFIRRKQVESEELFDLGEISWSYECPFCKEMVDMPLGQRSVTCPKCNAIFLTTTIKENLSFQSHFVEEGEENE